MDNMSAADSSREERLAEALRRVLDWPLPVPGETKPDGSTKNGTVESWALPQWLAKIARDALDD